MDSIQKILVLGGSGFIGSNFIRFNVTKTNNKILNIDKLTYAGCNESLVDLESNKNYAFIKGDICDSELINSILPDFKPDYIINFAAESHVDKSISEHSDFINTNILGVYNLLKNILTYYDTLQGEQKLNFRFLHISTDEVYGSLMLNEPSFTELNKYDPSSPYSATKAASDHLVKAWYKTYNLPILLTNCSNNYGPHQFPEKLIPLIIINCLNEKQLPVYGNGENVRDWIHVLDHCKAILHILSKGEIGNSYNVGSKCEIKNIDIINKICEVMDFKKPRKNGTSYKELITFVKDRPGHDFRYSIDNAKVKEHTGWSPSISFENGITETIDWYIENENWWKNKINENK